MTEQEELLQEAEELLRSLGMPPGSRVRTDAAEERAAPAEESAKGGAEEAALSPIMQQAEQVLAARTREHAAAEQLRRQEPPRQPAAGPSPYRQAGTSPFRGRSVAFGSLSAAFGGEAASRGIQSSRPHSVPTAEHLLAAADAEAVDRCFERDARRYDGGFRMR